jgi:radical SAM protein with 4Fe4S-binding SPASM domain
MKLELFKTVVDQYEAMGGGRFSLTPIVGEPLSTPHVRSFLDYLHTKPSIIVEMITNGILVDKFGVDYLLERVHQWQISVSGFDEEMYKRLYRSSKYQKAKRNIIALLEANDKRKDKRHISISLRADKPLQEVLAYPDFQEALKYKPDITFLHRFSSLAGRITNDDFQHPVKFYGHRVKVGFSCVNATRGLSVLPDGRVLVCDCLEAWEYPDDLVLGNINEKSLLELWRGHERKEFLKTFKIGQKLKPVCETCSNYRPDLLMFTKPIVDEMSDNISRYNPECTQEGLPEHSGAKNRNSRLPLVD